MSRFLGDLLARSTGAADVVRPRIGSRFEPATDAPAGWPTRLDGSSRSPTPGVGPERDDLLEQTAPADKASARPPTDGDAYGFPRMRPPADEAHPVWNAPRSTVGSPEASPRDTRAGSPVDPVPARPDAPRPAAATIGPPADGPNPSHVLPETERGGQATGNTPVRMSGHGADVGWAGQAATINDVPRSSELSQSTGRRVGPDVLAVETPEPTARGVGPDRGAGRFPGHTPGHSPGNAPGHSSGHSPGHSLGQVVGSAARLEAMASSAAGVAEAPRRGGHAGLPDLAGRAAPRTDHTVHDSSGRDAVGQPSAAGAVVQPVVPGPTPARREAPTIRVSIGRIEVRASAPSPIAQPVTAPPARPRKPPISLEQYLERRSRGG